MHMVRSARELQGYMLNARDGYLGRTAEFHFDEETWTVRYLAAHAGGEFLQRCVLVSPVAVRRINDADRTIEIDLSLEQVNGGPGIEHRMSLIYSGGVAQGRFSVNRFVELVATNPAKLFGLYPRKGTIAVGSDADLVIFDPNRGHTISAQSHHMRVDYSMFEGTTVTGMPDVVLSRGQVLVEGEKFFGRPGQGCFLKRGACGGL
jgi:hypothetical protein